MLTVSKSTDEKDDLLYQISKKRCSYLLEKGEQKVTLTVDDPVVSFVEGYFKGFCEALALLGKRGGN